jgi:chorismate--pyruvate lyase
MRAMIHTRKSPGDAVWTPVSRLRRAQVPSRYLPWLLDTDSLTRRLIHACPSRFSVRLVDQRRARPLSEEAAALGLTRHVRALVRQVQLQCAAATWVCARTIIPATTLVGPCRRLSHLGNRSLGAVLFADPTLERGEVEVARLDSATRLYALVTAGLPNSPAEIWGRRSLFRVGGRPLLVSEYFLPVIPEFPS